MTRPSPARPRSLPPARSAALAALNACLASGGPDAQAALDSALAKRRLDPRDIGLATELFYGVLRLKGRLDAILHRFLDRPQALPVEALTALATACYELLYLDKVPAHASVNWGVDAVRLAAKGGLGGLANAVLRKVAALVGKIDEPGFFGPEDDPVQGPKALARRWSCPEWIVRLWLDAYGRERTLRYLQAQCAPPALGVVLPYGHARAGELAGELAAQPGLLARDGLGFAFAPGTRLDMGEDEPLLARQGFAGRQALQALDAATWPEPVWDACAGRGGKTRLLLELRKSVVASDVHRGRIRALETELPGVETYVCSALDLPPVDVRRGTVLLDAPCSGLGTLSRRPDIKWKRSPEDLNDLVALQARMLDAAFSRLEPGGRLAYVTCTLNPAENEEQVRGFLERTAGAGLIKEWTTPPESALGEFFYAALLECR
ncbi:MAG: transcription antitermination factor NusB [Desulfovibrionaceae bacterium]